MIVRQGGPGSLHLITQPDHAALARRIMERWTPLGAAGRRASILIAIEEHDNGWREPDGSPTIDPGSGRIADFVHAPVAVRQGVWPRGVARLAHDPWAAALVAQHALTVYDRFRGDEAWKAFFAQMEAMRNRFVDAAATPLPDLIADYRFLRIGDFLSLMFCNAWEEAQHYDEWTFTFAGERVTVSPDGFGGAEVPIAVPAIEVRDRPFATDADLQAAIASGRRLTLTGAAGAAREVT